MSRAWRWQLGARGLAALLLALPACGPRVARETVVDAGGIRVLLRSEQHEGRPLDRGYAHPVTIAPVRVAHILARIDVRPEQTGEASREPAIRTELLRPIGEGIAEALGRADSSQQVVVMATRRERHLGIFTREYLTSLIAYVEDESLQIHLARLDWPVPRSDAEELPEPWVDAPGRGFRVLPAEGVVPRGAQSVSVVWRDPVFRSPAQRRVSPSGRVLRRTILMETPEEEPAGPEDPAGEGERLTSETRRRLADLEAARRRGEITEAEYQAQREQLLAADPAGN